MRRFLIWVGVFILLGFLTTGCGVRWQVKDTWIYVYENSSQGVTLPLQRALVSIAGEGYTATRYTSAEGVAFFQIPPGTYTVQVSKSGYTTVTDTIVIYTLELTPGRYYYVLVPQGG